MALIDSFALQQRGGMERGGGGTPRASSAAALWAVLGAAVREAKQGALVWEAEQQGSRWMVPDMHQAEPSAHRGAKWLQTQRGL